MNKKEFRRKKKLVFVRKLHQKTFKEPKIIFERYSNKALMESWVKWVKYRMI